MLQLKVPNRKRLSELKRYMGYGNIQKNQIGEKSISIDLILRISSFKSVIKSVTKSNKITSSFSYHGYGCKRNFNAHIYIVYHVYMFHIYRTLPLKFKELKIHECGDSKE